jgi:hypothetical protein
MKLNNQQEDNSIAFGKGNSFVRLPADIKLRA